MQIKDIEWIDAEVIVASFFTILVMIITFSITNGIAIGFLSYTIISLINKKYYQLNSVIYVFDGFFIIYFIVFAFVQ